MNNRYKKFMFENGEGITFEAIAKKGRSFEISEGTNGELIIKVIDVGAVAMEEHSSKNYANPPIPKGYKHTDYIISKSENGKPQSKKGVKPWVNINFNDAQKVASQFENSETVKSHLTFGCE